MRLRLITLPLTAAALLGLSSLPLAAEETTLESLAGDYGDREGRLRCGADGEFLRFEANGDVYIFEGDDGELTAKLSLEPDDRVRMTLLEDGGDEALLLTVNAGELTITGAQIDGADHGQMLDGWQSNFGGFVRCEALQ